MNTNTTPATSSISAFTPVSLIQNTPVVIATEADAASPCPPRSLFTHVDDFLIFKAEWKELAKSRTMTSVHMAAHALLMGRSIDAAFTPICNPVKLANGQQPHSSRDLALNILRRGKVVPAGLALTMKKYSEAVSIAANEFKN